MSNNDSGEDLINIRTSFVWIIKNFPKYLQKTKPYEIKSPLLITGSQKDMCPKWYFDIQLNNKDAKDFVSLHLNLLTLGKSKSLKVTLRCSIINMSGNLDHTFEYDYEFLKMEGFGVDQYIKKDEIIKDREDLLPNDELRLLCEIINHNTDFIYMPNVEDISEDFEDVFEKKLLSDVTIIGKNKVFPVHKVILSARSRIFFEMFTTNVEDVKIEIKDFNDDVIEELLRFIYTGKVENLSKVVDDLIKAAEKYKLSELKTLCLQALCKTITVQNVVKRLMFAASDGNVNLKTLAIKFIFENRKEVIKTEDYKFIENSHQHLLADAFQILLENS